MVKWEELLELVERYDDEYAARVRIRWALNKGSMKFIQNWLEEYDLEMIEAIFEHKQQEERTVENGYWLDATLSLLENNDFDFFESVDDFYKMRYHKAIEYKGGYIVLYYNY